MTTAPDTSDPALAEADVSGARLVADGPDDKRRGRLPTLVEGTAVLLRPGNRVHVGSDPHNSLVLELPPRVSGKRGANLLTSLTQPRTRPEVFADLIDTGLTRDELDTILTRLVASGKARRGPITRARTQHLRIRIHGQGPLPMAQ